jgi:hypothetical protein
MSNPNWSRPRIVHSTVPVITIEPGKLDRLASKGEAALIAAGVDFYTRGGQVVRPIIDEVEASKGRKTKTARLLAVCEATMLDYLCRWSRWEKYDKRTKKAARANPPGAVARIILARDGEWNFKPLAGVITAPTMRPDGSIFSTPGYDPQTRLVLFDPPPMPPLIPNASRDDALAALALFEDLLAEFPFINEASKSVALSALITPVVRGAMGVAPLHAFRAPAAGSGKSYLVDLASAIPTGRLCPVIAAGRTEEETEKRLGGAMLLGYPVISIDNLNGELGGDCLCQLVERPIVSVRALGSSRLYQIESRSTVFATGNNIQPTGDIIRRVILCSLDPDMERPEQRKFYGDPVSTVLADRGKYIAAAMTIVRAYLNSGQTDPMMPLASFEEWSHLVRSPLVWLGKQDPVSTMEAARAEDNDLQTLRSVVAEWKEAAGFNNPMSTGGLKTFAEELEVTAEGDYHQRHNKNLLRSDFHQALLDVSSKGGEIDAKRLGCYLSHCQHRVVDGAKIMADDDLHKKQKLWWLKSIAG